MRDDGGRPGGSGLGLVVMAVAGVAVALCLGGGVATFFGVIVSFGEGMNL